jgi:hypothetical protein
MVPSMSDDAEYYDMVMRPIERFLVEVFEHSPRQAKLYARLLRGRARREDLSRSMDG